MNYDIKKKYHFHAAHRNKQAGEKCGRIHGHTYRVVCRFGFNEFQKVNGITIPFSEIDALVEPLIKDFDHYLILSKNDSLCAVLEAAGEHFMIVPFETSAENLAEHFFKLITNETKLPLIALELSETDSSTVIYSGR